MTTDLYDPAARLAAAETPAEMLCVAIELSKPGLTAKAARHSGFGTALNRLWAWIAEGAEGDRLQALAVLARLRRQNRTLPQGFERRFLEAVSPLKIGVAGLEDPKERDYLAQALRLIRFEGQAQYLAWFVAGEGQTRTEARDTATLALLERAPSLEAAFELLSEGLRSQSHETQDPATSRMRRLLRVLEALAAALRQLDPLVGPETGDAYVRLLRPSLSTSAERAVAVEVTDTALAVLLAWVRPNFSSALEPRTFGAVTELRRLFLPARWPDETKASRAAVGRLVREAIALLAQAGVTDDKLRNSLVVALDAHVAAAALRELARDRPGLSNEVRYWLETGRPVSKADNREAVAESVLETIDRDLAEAFRDGASVTDALQSQSGMIQEILALSQPALADAAAEMFARTSRLARRVEAVGAKRGFELQGEADAAVAYAPTDHAADRPIAGARVVRLVSPMVVRRSAGGAPQLILKGKVVEA